MNETLENPENASLNAESCRSHVRDYSSVLWHFITSSLQVRYLSKKIYGHFVTLCGFRAERKAIASCDKQVGQMATCQLRQIPRFTHFICHVSTRFVATKFKSGISDSRFTFWHVYAPCNTIPQPASGWAIGGHTERGSTWTTIQQITELFRRWHKLAGTQQLPLIPL
jgi:hypothetical protein